MRLLVYAAGALGLSYEAVMNRPVLAEPTVGADL